MKDFRVRVQKFLADNGVASRRKAEELIEQRFVKVNGRPVKLGDKVDPKRDVVTVHGKVVERKAGGKAYIMLNKPRGYITTLSDEMGRHCVADLIKDIKQRIYPVGRLDRESEGLLLMTSDGDFANKLTHPSTHIPKTYRVTIRPSIDDGKILQMREGMMIDGRKTAPADVTILSEEDNRVILEIVLYEGRNRQIRKMCEALHLEVARLKRVAVGTLKLGMLKPGKWRELTEREIELLVGPPEAKRNFGSKRRK